MTRRYSLSLLLAAFILTGCGGGSSGSSLSASGSGSGSSSGASATNIAALTVGPGPAGTNGGTFNIPYASVTICQPGTSTCATINDLLVDTGSSGVRILASAVAAAGLTLPDMTDPNDSSNTIGECLPFVDGYTWGPLATATIQIGGETASSTSINIIDDNGTYNPSVPTACTTLTTNTSLNSITAFNANGVLGIGVFAQDCGSGCSDCVMDGGCTSQNDVYYSCNATSNTCTSTPIALTLQVGNPVIAFATDNNGVILDLPAIASSGATSVSGSLIFGIDTQSNNSLGSATVLTTDFSGFFTSTFNGQALGSSFIDSGSNALFFADSSLTPCGSSAPESEFYCPASTQSLSTVNQGHDAGGVPIGVTSTVSFQIANLNAISGSEFAIDDVGGTAASSSGTDTLSDDFDFGLPFFYGRRVFTAVEGAAAGGNTGPFFAY